MAMPIRTSFYASSLATKAANCSGEPGRVTGELRFWRSPLGQHADDVPSRGNLSVDQTLLATLQKDFCDG
jgi:hypothetical protein